MDNVFSAPLPGTALRIITEEWKVLSGFHALVRRRMKLEAEHLLQLRQLHGSIDLNWSKSGVWALISPVIDLWNSQMDILEECGMKLNEILESCPTRPSPDEPEEDVIPSSRYASLHGSHQAYQDCQMVASSREGIAELQGWFGRNRFMTALSSGWEPLPMIDRNYRESVVAQRNTLRPIAEWHSKRLPEKLDGHVQYAEETQTCLRDYLAESSNFTSDLVEVISTAQKRLADFSSLALIDPSQRCFENESSHSLLQPAVYLHHCLGGVPAEPVLGVMSYLPKLLDVGGNERSGLGELNIGHILEAETESISFDETVQKLKRRSVFTLREMPKLAMRAIGPWLPIGEDAIRRYKNGIKRDEITVLLKPFPVERCQMTATAIEKLRLHLYFEDVARCILGSRDAKGLLEEIWQKWDFENHRPLPRDVVRRSKWNEEKRRNEWKLVFKKTDLPYQPPQ